MKPAEKVSALLQHAKKSCGGYDAGSYPADIVSVVLFHKLHVGMSMELARKSYKLLQQQFVDWNEVRVSSVREIQEHLRGAENPLELAVFIKDFLEHVHRERHRLWLEDLVEGNLTEVRRFFKAIKGIDAATVDLVLHLRKAHPVVPLTDSMDGFLQALSIGPKTSTRDQRQKWLFTHVEEGEVLPLHHFLLDVGQKLPTGGGKVKVPAARGQGIDGVLRQLGGSAPAKKSDSKTSGKATASAQSPGKVIGGVAKGVRKSASG